MAGSTTALWGAFGLVHVWTTLLGVVLIPAAAFHDVDLYRWWMYLALDEGTWPVLDGPWVYPAGALVPMLLPGLVTTWSTPGYALAWCALVTVLNAVAVAVLLRTPGGRTGAWWWLAFLVLLGPVWLGRLDGVVAAVVVIALAVGLRRPAVAAALVTAGAWVKVAPGAVVLPLLAGARRPVRSVVLPAAAVCAVVVGAVAAGGGLANVASFLGTQGDRDLQTESVVATPWVVASTVRDDVTIELDEELITWEVHGPGAVAAAGALDVLLPLAVLLVGLVLLRARRAGRAGDAFLPASLCLLVLLVVLNKVGSPQFMAWIGAGVAVVVASRAGRTGLRGAVTAPIPALVLVAAGLTQVFFPWGYAELLSGHAVHVTALVVRNLLLVVVLVLAARELWLSAARPRPGPAPRGGPGPTGPGPAGTAAPHPPAPGRRDGPPPR